MASCRHCGYPITFVEDEYGERYFHCVPVKTAKGYDEDIHLRHCDLAASVRADHELPDLVRSDLFSGKYVAEPESQLVTLVREFTDG